MKRKYKRSVETRRKMSETRKAYWAKKKEEPMIDFEWRPVRNGILGKVAGFVSDLFR